MLRRCGWAEEIPAELLAAGEGGEGEGAELLLEGGIVGQGRAVVRGLELFEDALQHLGGGLAGEGHGEDLFGLLRRFRGRGV